VKSAAFDPDWLARRLADLLPAYPEVSLCVALSGGADSVALVAAAAAIPDRPPLRAVHVHHGLHANADHWSRHCRGLARLLKIPLTVIHVRVARPRGASLEAAAREARYAALGHALKRGEILLTAHHQDDQLETVLLQLLRGAGIAGLAAMPEIAAFASGQLVRPLLTRTRAELEEWVRAQGLPWIEDDTNADELLDRNYLRRSILPRVRERWPAAAAAVSRSARHAAEARRLLNALARADAELAAVGAGLCARRLRALDVDRRRNALRYWITRSGFTAPDTRRLEELAGALLDARADAHPAVRWNDTLVERQADVLSIRHSVGERKPTQAAALEVEWRWRELPRLALGGSLAQRTSGKGVSAKDASARHAAARIHLEIVPDPHGPLDRDALPDRLIVRARHGGETIRPGIGARSRKLKALLQEARVPPAERARLPLLYAPAEASADERAKDKLIAVGDRWVDAAVAAGADTPARRRARIRLTR
jgi:tRNA(Ile)-lysidine synthase